MKYEELLELAILDADGVLDSEQSELFERAFAASSPEIQAQIRREQTRQCIAAVLPKVEPPIGLRARVIAAMLRVTPAGRAQARAGASDALAKLPALRPATSVSRWWRTATIGAAAAALVFGFFSLQLRREFSESVRVAQNSEAAAKLAQEFGDRFTPQFFSPNTRFVQFTPVGQGDASGNARAVLMLDRAGKRAQLLCKDLPPSSTDLEVVVVRAGQPEKSVTTFKSSASGLSVASINAIDIENATEIVIREVGSSTALLRSVRL